MLWGLTQECLNRTRFPLGEMQKPAVRAYVFEAGYEEFSKKSESYEICFVPDNDYRGFLKRRVPELQNQVRGGNFVNNKGEVIGTHEGYPFYTIGQRKGLGKAFGQPMFVTQILPDSNTVVLGEMDELMRNGMSVGKINLQKYAQLPFEGMEAVTHIRYNDPGALSFIKNHAFTEGAIGVEFFANVKGVAPGQSAVFYEGDDVVGGGIIMGSFLN